jgi:calmodulin
MPNHKFHKELSEEELAELKEIFDLADSDGGGSIDQDELGNLLKMIRLHCTEEQLESIFNEADTDGGGSIEFSEFVTVCSRSIGADYSASLLTQAFKHFSAPEDSDGYISTYALEETLANYGVEQKKISEVLNTLDPDKTGVVYYTSYVNIISAGLMQDISLFNVNGMSRKFTNAITSKLRPKLFKPSDVIIRKGELIREMYFICSGFIEVLDDGKVKTTLTEGGYFGESILIPNVKRTAENTIRSGTYSDVFVLHQRDLQEVCSQFPNDFKLVLSEVTKNVK